MYGSRIFNDLERKDLWILKILSFLQTGGLVIIFPFLPLHMKELGLDFAQISFVQSLTSIFDTLVPLGLGYVSAHFTNIRYLFIGCLLMNALSSLLLAQVSSTSTTMFLEYIAARTLLETSRSCCLNLFESVNLMTIKTKHADYGIQKVFGSIGGAVFGPLSGYLLHNYSFETTLHLYSILQVVFCLIVCLSQLQFEKAEGKKENGDTDWKSLLRGKTIIGFLAVSLFLGSLWSFSETFLFIHLETVGFSRKDLGQSIAVSTVIGILVSLNSSHLLDNYGWQAGITLTLVSYAVRLGGYAIISKGEYPQLLFLESLKCLGNPLMMLTAGFFIKNFVSLHDIPRFQGLFGSVYFGVGKGLGSLVGGSIVGYCGTKLSFQMSSLLCMMVATGVCISLRSTIARKDGEKDKPY